MKRNLTLVIGYVILLGTVSAWTQTEKIGTFDKRSIVVAFYGSPVWKATLKAKSAEMDDARRNQDRAKVKALEKWGRDSQELAHRQVEGAAPIDNILLALAPVFRELEQTEHFAKIVPAPCEDKKAQTADVTDRLLEWLQTDERTWKIIEQLRHL